MTYVLDKKQVIANTMHTKFIIMKKKEEANSGKKIMRKVVVV